VNPFSDICSDTLCCTLFRGNMRKGYYTQITFSRSKRYGINLRQEATGPSEPTVQDVCKNVKYASPFILKAIARKEQSMLICAIYELAACIVGYSDKSVTA
jgi:hypothetical protein